MIGKVKFFKVIKITNDKIDNKNTSCFWTSEEDQTLLKVLNDCKRNKWKTACSILKNRTPIECCRRFHKLNKSIKKGRWTREEDYKLLKLINIFGESWKSISKLLKNRTCRQIRNRYKCYLTSQNKEH